MFNDPNGDHHYVEKGDKGEAMALSFLAWRSPDVTIHDVRTNRKFQAQDVDFLLNLSRPDAHSLEVKSDQHIARTGNICFEPLRVHHTMSRAAYLGWSVFSEAEWLFVWCPPASALYTLRMSALRSGFQRYIAENRPKKIRTEWIDTDNLRTTLNVLVPIRYVTHRRYEYANAEWHCLQEEQAS